MNSELLNRSFSTRPLGGVRPMFDQDGDNEEGDSAVSSRNLIVELFLNPAPYELDLTFKAFALPTGRFRVWSGNPKKLQELDVFLREIAATDHSPEDMLYQVLEGLGFSLRSSVEKMGLAGSEVFSIGRGELLICLDTELSVELIEAMVEEAPDMILCLDHAFQHNSQLSSKRIKSTWK